MAQSRPNRSAKPGASKGVTPPLTPVLIAGFVARPLPPAVLNPFLGFALRAIERRHPGLFERLAELDRPTYLIDPVDLPFVFVLEPDPLLPSLRAFDSADGIEATATIRGSLLALVDLMEGRVDGDALFFSRELTIEGDTGAVVALRNAMDGAEISLVDDALAMLGPVGEPARAVVGGVGALFERAQKDLETLRAAAIAPAMRRADGHSAEMRDLEEKINRMGRRPRRAPKVESGA